MCDTCAFLFLRILKNCKASLQSSRGSLSAVLWIIGKKGTFCASSPASPSGRRGPGLPGAWLQSYSCPQKNSGHRKATSRERHRSDEWYHQPLQKAAKARRQRRLQRRRTAPAGEMSQPGRRTLRLFRRPSLDSASCNLKECQSVAEVQSSLKGPTLWVCSWSILDRLEGPIVNKLIRVGGQMLLPSAVTDRTGQDRTGRSTVDICHLRLSPQKAIGTASSLLLHFL